MNIPIIIGSILYFALAVFIIQKTIIGTRNVDTSYLYRFGFLFLLAAPLIALFLAMRYGKINLEGAGNSFMSLLFFTVFVAGIYVIIYAIGNFSKVTSTISVLIMSVIVIGALSIINESANEMGIGFGASSGQRKASWLRFAWEFVFYIPCLFTDFVKYMKQQLEITSSTVWTLFVIEIILLICYLNFPAFAAKVIIHDGNQLINEPMYLNEKINLGNVKGIIPKTSIISTPINAANTDFTLSLNPSVKCDTTTFTANLSKMRGRAMDVYGNTVDISCGEYYATYGGGYKKITGCSFEECDQTYATMLASSGSGSTSYIQKYSLAFWVFMNPQPPSHYGYGAPTNILRIGKYSFDTADAHQQGIPMITYFDDVDTNNIGDNGEKRYIGKYRIYLTNTGIQYRDIVIEDSKWNLFVINYTGNKADIFVNGELVVSETIKDHPTYDDTDSFIVGEDGGLDGAICNLVFFPHILTQQEIYNYYYMLYWKNPPVININK